MKKNTRKSAAIQIFTDGACSGNPGPGGWAFLVFDSESDFVFEAGGGEAHTTNNRMELRAAIEALRFAQKGLPRPGVGRNFEIFTDSKLLIEGITKWIFGWQKRDWQKSDGAEVANRELWQELVEVTAINKNSLDWIYVPGHSHVLGNNRVDEIAVSFSKKNPVKLYSGPAAQYPHAEIFSQDWTAESAPRAEKKKSSSKKGPVLCYLSCVDGKIERHPTWAACEARVKGKRGAKHKKVQSEAEIAELTSAWGAD